MKVYHFALIFVLFFLAVFVRTDIVIGNIKTIINEKKQISESIDTAAYDSINYLVRSGVYGTNAINKDEVISRYFNSLYSSMGITAEFNKQTELELYIPVMLLCDYDGYYIYYYDDYLTSDGKEYSDRTWSEKVPYYYKDEYFIYRFTLSDTIYLYDVNNLLNSDQKMIQIDYHEFQVEELYSNFRTQHSNHFLLNKESFDLVKKGTIIKQLEDAMSFYTSRHNSIARQNGITYTFSFPSGHRLIYTN